MPNFIRTSYYLTIRIRLIFYSRKHLRSSKTHSRSIMHDSPIPRESGVLRR